MGTLRTGLPEGWAKWLDGASTYDAPGTSNWVTVTPTALDATMASAMFSRRSPTPPRSSTCAACPPRPADRRAPCLGPTNHAPRLARPPCLLSRPASTRRPLARLPHRHRCATTPSRPRRADQHSYALSSLRRVPPRKMLTRTLSPRTTCSAPSAPPTPPSTTA